MPTKPANPGPHPPQQILKPTQAKPYLRPELELYFIINRSVGNYTDNNFLGAVRDFSKRILKQDSGCTYNEESDLHAAELRELHPHLEGARMRISLIMTMFWIRFRGQSGCLSVFMHLHKQGLVSLQGLEEPMELRRWQDPQIGNLIRILGSFSKFRHLFTSWIFKLVNNTNSVIGVTPLQ
jgi:hypothetical protein